MGPGGHAAPAEDPHPEEDGFEEKDRQPLEHQGSVEDVADEAGVLGPVHAELELLHDAGDHPHREVDQEEVSEEPGGPVPALVAGALPDCLHDGHHWGEAYG